MKKLTLTPPGWNLGHAALFGLPWLAIAAPLAFAGWKLSAVLVFPVLPCAAAMGMRLLSQRVARQAEMKIVSSGILFRSEDGAPTDAVQAVAWGDILAVDYSWGSWQPDPWGSFPECHWLLDTGDGRRHAIEDTEKNRDLLCKALARHLEGFACDWRAMNRQACKEYGSVGTVRCWARQA